MKIAVPAALALVTALAAAPVLAQPTPPKLAIEAPNYVSIPMEIVVNKPAAEVWKRVGKFCDIGEWLQIPSGCKITSGADGQVGAVRTVGREVLVGKTELSYSYTQPVYEGRAYNLYHGTLEARPLTGKTSKIVYTLMYDNSGIPGDDAAKQPWPKAEPCRHRPHGRRLRRRLRRRVRPAPARSWPVRRPVQ
jgi:hypothetical protein